MKTSNYTLLFLIAFSILISCDDKETEDDMKRSYTKSIERIYGNDFEADLIDKVGSKNWFFSDL